MAHVDTVDGVIVVLIYQFKVVEHMMLTSQWLLKIAEIKQNHAQSLRYACLTFPASSGIFLVFFFVIFQSFLGFPNFTKDPILPAFNLYN